MVEKDGNGAREKVILFYMDPAHFCGTTPERTADELLAWLWEQGYQVVPIPPTEGDEEDAQPDAARSKQKGAKIYPFGLFKKKPDGE